MNFLKNVWADLLERRLWPVAIALVVALVAVPVVLGRGGDSTAAAPAADVAPVASTPPGQLVSLSTLKPKGAPLGPRHNPFRDQGGAAPSATPVPSHSPQVTSVPSTGGTSSAVPAPSTPAPAPTGPVTRPPSNTTIGAPATPPSSTPRGDSTPRSYAAGYRVDVTYGRSGTTHAHDDLARLDPLSALQAPLVLFLGVKDDGKSAVFMVLSDAAVTGDGVCRPSAADCQVIGLKAGDAELFDVPASDGRALRYELQVDKVARRTVSSSQASVTARHRESKAGRSLLRKAISASKGSYVNKYRYALGKGVVTKVMPARAAG